MKNPIEAFLPELEKYKFQSNAYKNEYKFELWMKKYHLNGKYIETYFQMIWNFS